MVKSQSVPPSPGHHRPQSPGIEQCSPASYDDPRPIDPVALRLERRSREQHPGNTHGLVEKHLRPGALMIADNTDYYPEYLAHVRLPQNGYLNVRFGDDIEVSMRLGLVITSPGLGRRPGVASARTIRSLPWRGGQPRPVEGSCTASPGLAGSSVYNRRFWR